MADDQPGFALRFPRIVSLRTEDKKPEDSTSVREIREMFDQQRQPGRGRRGRTTWLEPVATDQEKLRSFPQIVGIGAFS
jgi:hypothetical protein